jgi:hypothetical protein
MVLKWDFFIAHAGPDIGTAQELFGFLSASSQVFLDKERLLLGDDWDTKIAQAQQSSLITLVLVSSKTERAYYQREEIAAAIDMARKAAIAQELKAGEADRFLIKIGFDKSSRHRFRARLRFNGGRELMSPPTELRGFVPRSGIEFLREKKAPLRWAPKVPEIGDGRPDRTRLSVDRFRDCTLRVVSPRMSNGNLN